ncbi:hypothetical protein GCM10027422_34510 [Hymenobacter arcticus]
MQGTPYLQYPYCLDRLQWQELTDIKISTTTTATRLGQSVKGFTFRYNNNANERLTLLGVTEQGSSIGSAKPPYRFGYNKYHNLPEYLLDRNDHWGFYNKNYVERGNASPNYLGFYSHREPSQDSAVYLAGMLTRIVYPTGGVTDFQFEQHGFGTELAENRYVVPPAPRSQTPAGGVRIKKITSYSPDQPNQKLEKEYFYVIGFASGASAPNPASLPSSGVLGGRSRYTWGSYKARSWNQPATSYSRTLFSAQSVLPASSNSAGSHIGYSNVVEKRSDGSYTQYAYSNFTAGNGDPGHLDEPPLNQLQVEFTDPDINDTNRILYAPYCSTEEERGKLLREEAFNSAGQRVRQKVIDYVAFNKDTEFVRAINGSSAKVCVESPASFDEGASYKLYTYSYLPIRETETLYDPSGNNPITTVRNKAYSSLGYRLVTSESSTDSKNQTITTTYRYPFDITFPGSSTATQPLTDPVASAVYAMTAKNMIGSPIETITTRNDLVTAATVQTYRLGGLNNSSILPFQYFSLEAAQPLSQYTPTSYGNLSGSKMIIGGGIPQMQLKATFTQYDAKGNLLNLVKNGVTNADYTVTGGTTSSYLWSYQNTLPLAKVENAVPAEIFHSSFEEDKMIATAAPDVPGTWFSPYGYLKFEATPSDRPSLRNAAHTGQLAAAMYTTYQGEQGQAFGPTLTIPGRAKRFIFSGWVYSNGPAAQIWLLINQAGARNADGTINYYDYLNNNLTPVNLSTNVTGQWVFLEQEVDVPANATLLTLRLTNFWNDAGRAAASVNGGGVWFDDVRIHPADAQMTSYTHSPLIGVSSMSDANNHPVYYDYDELSRLWLVRDQNRNIIKHYQYHYQR